MVKKNEIKENCESDSEFELDHIAIVVGNIKKASEWYKETVCAKIEYIDDSWAMLNIYGTKIALVLKDTHPSHIAFKCKSELELENFVDLDNQVKVHRDGSSYIYLVDPYGNALEWVYYP